MPDRGAARARAIAAEAVRAVEEGASLDAALEGRTSGADPDQRGLVRELAYGTCRWYHRLRAAARLMLSRPVRRKDLVGESLILVGLYQWIYTRVQAHAALAETVEAARLLGKPAASGLVNAVLRRFQRESSALRERVDKDPATRYAYPAWLFSAIREAWPADWQSIVDGGNERPPMTVRVNLRRASTAAYAAQLADAGIVARPVHGLSGALMLDRAVGVDRLPGFSEGLVSVQDVAAQHAARLLDVREGDRVLDACAAPGGKTAHIAELAPRLGSLVAVDIDAARLTRVEQNLARLQLDAEVMNGDASAPQGVWASRQYDRILLDAPCSASGVIRRHPDIKLLRRNSDIATLVAGQRRMLGALWPMLAPGGILLYSTCSVLPAENADQVGEFLGAQSDADTRPFDLPCGRATGQGWQIFPGDAGCDGFFYARLEKRQA